MSNQRWTIKPQRLWISDEEFYNIRELDGEEWKDLYSYKGCELKYIYQVSNKGRIRKKGYNNPLVGAITFDGYHEVTIYTACVNSTEKRSFTVRVHSLVLTLFQGPPPAEMVQPTVQHLNHDKLDNRIENLCWMSAFDNNQEGHGVRTKVVDRSGEHLFNSQKVASTYIGRYADYIAECINCGYRITSKGGEAVEVYTEKNNEWVKYSRPVPGNRTWCRLVKDGETFNFESYQECDKFLGKSPGYTTYIVSNSWPLLEGDYKFFIFDKVSSSYKEYVPTSKRLKHFARRCVVTNNSEVHNFPSISAAAKFLGRDSEYVRLAVRDNKTVKDCNGNIVNVEILDDYGSNAKREVN